MAIEHKSISQYHPVVIVFLLFQNDPKAVKATAEQPEQEAKLPDFSRIRCPICKWQPKPPHRWFCAPCDHPEYFDDGRGACWNTFSTRARIPGTQYQFS
jgi:hypothetical protein